LRQDDAAKLSQDSGIDVQAGLVHSIDPSEVRHSFGHHGDAAKEIMRGQIGLLPDDYLLIPEVTLNYDSVVTITTEKELPGLQYQKRIGNTFFVVEEMRTGRKELSFITLFKRNDDNKGGAPSASTPEATAVGPDAASDKPRTGIPVSHTPETTTVEPDARNAEHPSGEQTSTHTPEVKLLANAQAEGMTYNTLQSSGGGTSVPIDPNKPALPDTALNHADVIPLSGVIDALGKALNVPIRTGKMGQSGRGALGIFKISPEVIRTKTTNDIATVVHEAGHFIQKELFGGIDWKPLAPFRDELRAMATKPRAGQSPLPEGFAEFVAKYVVDPAAALRDAPKFYEHFENQVINQAPEFGKALLNAREAVKKWAEQPAAQEVLSHISVEGREGEGFLGQLLSRDTWDRLYTNFLDRLYPLKKATDLLAAGEELPADMNPYQAYPVHCPQTARHLRQNREDATRCCQGCGSGSNGIAGYSRRKQRCA
jgi:hypothetical protein